MNKSDFNIFLWQQELAESRGGQDRWRCSREDVMPGHTVAASAWTVLCLLVTAVTAWDSCLRICVKWIKKKKKKK